MELLQLQYFQKVAQLEHITKAAEEIRISQPALSKTIARLEKDLGAPLFERKGKNIYLNAFGKAFLKKVEAALTLLEDGRKEIEDLAGLEKGRICLATTTHKCFSNTIGSFISLHPDVKLQIIQASTEEKIQKLRNGDLDFCITFPPIDDELGIEGISFLTEEILLAVPSTHRLANRTSIDLHEVTDDSFISIKNGNPFKAMTDQFCQEAGFSPKVICEVDEYPAIMQFLQAGLGIAFLPETLFEEKDPSFHLLHINKPICQRTYQLAWLKDRYLSQAAISFREFLFQSFM